MELHTYFMILLDFSLLVYEFSLCSFAANISTRIVI